MGIPGVSAPEWQKGTENQTPDVGDKKYECKSLHAKATTKFPGQVIEAVIKVWIAKDVPLGGRVGGRRGRDRA
jgi:hypothetical protein